MMDAILVERDYKGQYERFALTPEEFKEAFPGIYKDLGPIEESISVTISPMVHITFERCNVGDEKWNGFFTDMALGLPESDVEAGNLAYIREGLFQSLKEYLPDEVMVNKIIERIKHFEATELNSDEEIEVDVDDSTNMISISRCKKEDGRCVSVEDFCSVDDVNVKKLSEALLNEGVLCDLSKAFETNYYHFTVDYNENGQKKSFEIKVVSPDKPDSKWLAETIRNYFSAHYNGSLEKALNSVEGIDVHIQDSQGEYVDSDEIYGDDLKDLFEHLKKDKPGLDSVISEAKQRQDNSSDKNSPSVEPER